MAIGIALTLAALLAGQAPADEPKTESPAKVKPSAKAKAKAKEAEQPFVGLVVRSWKYDPPASPGLIFGMISIDAANTGDLIQAGMLVVTTRDRNGVALETGSANFLSMGTGQGDVLQASVKHNPAAVSVTFTLKDLLAIKEGVPNIPVKVLAPPARPTRRTRR